MSAEVIHIKRRRKAGYNQRSEAAEARWKAYRERKAEERQIAKAAQEKRLAERKKPKPQEPPKASECLPLREGDRPNPIELADIYFGNRFDRERMMLDGAPIRLPDLMRRINRVRKNGGMPQIDTRPEWVV